MKILRTIVGLGMIVGVAALFAVPALAQTSYGGGGVQGYAADTDIGNGTIVQLTGKDSNRVKVAVQAEAQNMFGVTVDRALLPVTLSNEGLENEVFVAASGTYNVLVSTQGGPIAVNDYITLSSINGIGMNAGIDKTTVFGRAVGSFDGTGVTLGTMTLKDVDGNENNKVSIGMIPVTIKIERNPNDISTKAKVPEFLERIGQAIAEKEVSAIRIYISLAITAISLITAIVVLYSGVRHGIISIGRNPMSKKSVFRALLEIILTSILILIVGLFAVYLLLRL